MLPGTTITAMEQFFAPRELSRAKSSQVEAGFIARPTVFLRLRSDLEIYFEPEAKAAAGAYADLAAHNVFAFTRTT